MTLSRHLQSYILRPRLGLFVAGQSFQLLVSRCTESASLLQYRDTDVDFFETADGALIFFSGHPFVLDGEFRPYEVHI